MALLEITDLTTHIQLSRSVVHALDRVSLRLEAGETLGLVGESGSGKTMTAMSIERLLPPGGRIVGGKVVFDGVDLVTLPDPALREIRGAEIGMIFQDPMTSLNPVQTIGAQVAEPLTLHRGVSGRDARDQVVEMFRLVGIPSPERRYFDYPHQLSGGQRQRVMIAMALICHPKLLIADEPTTALDVSIQKQILQLVNDLRSEFGMAMILVTHDLGVIAGNTDQVAVMYAGQVVEQTSTEELFRRPKHRYTEALFEALPERAADLGSRLYSIPGLPPDLVSPPPACRFASRCRFASATCRTEDPVMETLPGSDHRYACFHPRPVDLQGPVARSEELEPSTALGAVAASADRREPVSESGASVTDVLANVVGSEAADGERLLGPSPHEAPLLAVRRLTKDFPVHGSRVLRRRTGAVSAVADVDLDIHPGTTTGLVGESGCGKTTLGRLVVGLESPTSGGVLFRGRPVAGLHGREARRHRVGIQLMFQDSYASLDPRMRVRQILREPLDIHRLGSPAARNDRVDRLLEAVGLPSTAGERYAHEFSGGQRQRIGLARALALEPDLIVADEPVSALDVSIQAQVLNLMKDLQRDLGLSYLFISHDLAVIRYLADQIAVMYLGTIVEIGSADDVYRRPQHPYTRGLIDTIPVADPAVESQKARYGVRGELPSATDPPSGCRFRTRCPIAQDICAQVVPPLQVGGGSSPRDAPEQFAHAHKVACHFPLEAVAAIPAVRPGATSDASV